MERQSHCISHTTATMCTSKSFMLAANTLVHPRAKTAEKSSAPTPPSTHLKGCHSPGQATDPDPARSLTSPLLCLPVPTCFTCCHLPALSLNCSVQGYAASDARDHPEHEYR